MKFSRDLLFIPSVRAGNGTGHLVRSLVAASQINERIRREGTGNGTAVYVPSLNATSQIETDTLLAHFPDVRIVECIAESPGTVLIVDRRRTEPAEARSLALLGHLVCVDEGGPARAFSDYLIDIFPPARRVKAANVADRGLLSLPDKRREFPDSFGKVLLSFGGEDPARLAEILTRALLSSRMFSSDQLTVVEGSACVYTELPPEVSVLRNVSRLTDIMPSYDLVFTSHGLTAYEAAASGAAVVLLNPSGYHRRLSRVEGFPSIGVRRPSMRRLRRLIADPPAIERALSRIIPKSRSSISELLCDLDFSRPRGCPLCGSTINRAVARFRSRTYFRCACTGLVYLTSFQSERKEYGASYFFSEYKKQYGRTYLDDFDHIQSMARPRLSTIEQMSGGVCSGVCSGARSALLDVGCAYGPFLAEARQRGFDAYGLDVADEAVAHVNQALGIPAAAADFVTFDVSAAFGVRGFSVLTMWYVIEHFERLGLVLEKANLLLETGGILALSTPNGEGVSGRRNLRKFLQESPPDHFTVWCPRTAQRVLRRYGFRLERVRITGHHPERFPWLSERSPRTLLAVARVASLLFGLGETFELYARKIRPCGNGQPHADSKTPGGARR